MTIWKKIKKKLSTYGPLWVKMVFSMHIGTSCDHINAFRATELFFLFNIDFWKSIGQMPKIAACGLLWPIFLTRRHAAQFRACYFRKVPHILSWKHLWRARHKTEKKFIFWKKNFFSKARESESLRYIWTSFSVLTHNLILETRFCLNKPFFQCFSDFYFFALIFRHKMLFLVQN